MFKIRRNTSRRVEPTFARHTAAEPDPGLYTQPGDVAQTKLQPDPNLGVEPRPRSAAARRDPAPSKTAYRLQRLWLTPLFRVFLRTGVPAFATALIAGIYLSDPQKSDAIVGWFADMRQSIQERPEFMLQSMSIEGASSDLSDDIREVVSMDFPISSFDADLGALRKTIEELDAVAAAEVRVRPGGVLQVVVKERVPAVVWRNRDGFDLLDPQGRLVAAASSRATAAQLPVLAGDGADQKVPQALALFAAAAPLGARVIGLMRMGERRWDVVLDRNQRIMLPEVAPVAALERVIALDQAEDLLARDLTVIDMRNASRPTIRLAQGAVAELKKTRSLE